MGLEPGWAIGLLVGFAALAIVSIYTAKRRTGRVLPTVLAVGAGIAAVLLVVLVVGIFVLGQ